MSYSKDIFTEQRESEAFESKLPKPTPANLLARAKQQRRAAEALETQAIGMVATQIQWPFEETQKLFTQGKGCAFVYVGHNDERWLLNKRQADKVFGYHMYETMANPFYGLQK